MNAKILLTFIVMAVTTASHAKQYQSLFGETSTSWIFQWGNLFGTTRDSLYAVKDTSINGMTYKKIATGNPYVYEGGFIREVLDSGKVYYREIYSASENNFLDTAERLLLRYDLNKGDQFDDRTVDSVNMIGGLKYIYLSNSGSEPYTMIEGIGLNVNLLAARQTPSIMMGQYLLCSYKNGEKTTYSNRLYNGNCSPSLGIGTEIINSQIDFAPNPASHFIQITNQTGKTIEKVAITGIDGRIYKTVLHVPTTGISVQELPKGYYFLHFFCDGQRLTKPLFIQ